MAQLYKRPPITEAVIEVRLGTAIEADALEKLQKRLLDDYPLPPQRIVNINVEFGEASGHIRHEFQGYRLTAADGAGIVSITPRSIATSQLAPYQGWEPFVALAQRNWSVWKRVAGWREIVRIGVRYINRIDIPNPDETPVSIEDYLAFSPRMPSAVAPLTGFALNATAPLGKDNLNLILNASTAPSVLVKTVSFIIDLDLSREADLPQNDQDLWALIDKIREYKNFVFEACITSRSRDLFLT